MADSKGTTTETLDDATIATSTNVLQLQSLTFEGCKTIQNTSQRTCKSAILAFELLGREVDKACALLRCPSCACTR